MRCLSITFLSHTTPDVGSMTGSVIISAMIGSRKLSWHKFMIMSKIELTGTSVKRTSSVDAILRTACDKDSTSCSNLWVVFASARPSLWMILSYNQVNEKVSMEDLRLWRIIWYWRILLRLQWLWSMRNYLEATFIARFRESLTIP